MNLLDLPSPEVLKPIVAPVVALMLESANQHIARTGHLPNHDPLPSTVCVVIESVLVVSLGVSILAQYLAAGELIKIENSERSGAKK